MEKALDLKAISQMLYSYSYKFIILILVGQNVPIFKIEMIDGALEINYIKALVGHLGVVICGDLMQNKDILVTIDDQVVIKFWSLSKLQCINTIDLDSKKLITHMIYLQKQNKLALVSKKINVYNFSKLIEEKGVFQNQILNLSIDSV